MPIKASLRSEQLPPVTLQREWMLCSLKEKIHTYVQQPLKMTPSAVPLAPASEARIVVLAANRLGFSPCSSGGDRFDPVTG